MLLVQSNIYFYIYMICLHIYDLFTYSSITWFDIHVSPTVDVGDQSHGAQPSAHPTSSCSLQRKASCMYVSVVSNTCIAIHVFQHIALHPLTNHQPPTTAYSTHDDQKTHLRDSPCCTTPQQHLGQPTTQTVTITITITSTTSLLFHYLPTYLPTYLSAPPLPSPVRKQTRLFVKKTNKGVQR
ncbi:hypothetical protein K504DRAFT_50946 [Pleomassaria siparia CBS 279.74]|uniref:Uncharacterized protein n=1 Tax=Pleomassaria siparia CBS 279.74 TaxID=1314801 RepID=A0A6G1K3N3_9PLEO|nr:hypothetical protein K504DRAFT_50946 [Pleomassaria siparia CBS 279.74]